MEELNFIIHVPEIMVQEIIMLFQYSSKVGHNNFYSFLGNAMAEQLRGKGGATEMEGRSN